MKPSEIWSGILHAETQHFLALFNEYLLKFLEGFSFGFGDEPDGKEEGEHREDAEDQASGLS